MTSHVSCPLDGRSPSQAGFAEGLPNTAVRGAGRGTFPKPHQTPLATHNPASTPSTAQLLQARCSPCSAQPVGASSYIHDADPTRAQETRLTCPQAARGGHRSAFRAHAPSPLSHSFDGTHAAPSPARLASMLAPPPGFGGSLEALQVQLLQCLGLTGTLALVVAGRAVCQAAQTALERSPGSLEPEPDM